MDDFTLLVSNLLLHTSLSSDRSTKLAYTGHVHGGKWVDDCVKVTRKEILEVRIS